VGLCGPREDGIRCATKLQVERGDSAACSTCRVFGQPNAHSPRHRVKPVAKRRVDIASATPALRRRDFAELVGVPVPAYFPFKPFAALT
jgi:hypothetical protein